MKNFGNRSVSVFLAIVMMLLSLSGCNSNKAKVEPQTDKTETTQTEVDNGSPDQEKYANSNKIEFFTDSKFNFDVIYPVDMISEQTRLARRVYRRANELSDGIPKYLTDKKAGENIDGKEILIGLTDRKESAEAREKLTSNRLNHYEDYIIAVMGNKIVIDAVSTASLEEAVAFFIDTFLPENGGSYNIPEDYFYIKADEYKTNMKIAGVDIVNYALVCEEYPSRLIYAGLEEIQSAVFDKTEYNIPIICTAEPEKIEYKIHAFSDEKGSNEYSIKASNKGIEISGGHTYSANAALHNLASNIKNIPANKVIEIPADYNDSGVYSDETLNTFGYNLVWSDEFNQGSLNLEDWHKPEYSDGYATIGVNGGNKSNNIYVEDGKLVARGNTEQTDKGMTYWGGETSTKFDFRFGLVEIRAKVPKGTGYWSAFWFNSTRTIDRNYGAEIDGFEFFGSDMWFRSQLHSWWPAGRYVPGLAATDSQNAEGHIQHFSSGDTNTRNSLDGKSFGDAYHTYTVEWTPDFIEFSCDGIPYVKKELSSMLKHPEYGYAMNDKMTFLNKSVRLILSNSIGRLGADRTDSSYINGAIDENTIIPNYFSIEWVHIYQKEGIGSFGEVV